MLTPISSASCARVFPEIFTASKSRSLNSTRPPCSREF
nr:MAG TPA: hypothetical protein [Caudoviricetes sp.]